MTVLLPLIQAKSGSDTFTTSLASHLNHFGTVADILPLPGWSAFFPSVAGRLHKPSGQEIIHASTWNAFAFKQDNPLIATEFHLVQDPVFKPSMTMAQRIYHRYGLAYKQKSISCADQVICISRYTQKMVEHIFGYSDTAMIYCGIDINRFRPNSRKEQLIDDNRTVLLYAGNFLTRKGVDLLIPIMNLLGDSYVLLTTTGLRTKNTLYHKNIIPLGKVPDCVLADVYNGCDIFLSPSRLEGFGLCVGEAMACAKPIVTTNHSSLPELVLQDKGGILCEVNNIHAYADAIRYLAADENLRADMGQFNRQRVCEKFTLDKMAREHIRIYNKYW
jgi:glycosyltransferase involved in cell wall biosynthesis